MDILSLLMKTLFSSLADPHKMYQYNRLIVKVINQARGEPYGLNPLS